MKKDFHRDRLYLNNQPVIFSHYLIYNLFWISSDLISLLLVLTSIFRNWNTGIFQGHSLISIDKHYIALVDIENLSPVDIEI